VKKPWTCGSL